MASVRLRWESIEFQAAEISGWVALRKSVDAGKMAKLTSNQAVYVIRVMRPYSFSYGNEHSPVAYIGKGKAQARITSHLKSWIPKLSNKIQGLRIKIYFCEPRVRRSGAICEQVEADLIQFFVEDFGHRPIRNLVSPSGYGLHEYQESELHVIRPGKGVGYHWAIRPLPSSHFYKQ
ncbi:MAG: hypothetical protein ACT6XY_03830 [Phreatobacter sp.]|uniref:hypothetical protein n=1 Tax=Phreatobacter sp. TaxID=1966341 RepID=UPI0040362041